MVHKLIKVLAKVVEVMISKEKRNGRSTHIGLVPGALRVAKIVRVTARVLDQPAVHLLLFLLLFILMLLLLLLWIYLTSVRKAPWDKFHIPIYLFQPNWPVWCMFWGTFFKSSKSWGIFQKNRFLGSIFGVFSCSAAISEPICMKFWLPG